MKLACPLCGDIYRIQLNKYEMDRYNNYRKNGGYIQDEMNSLNPVEREFLLTGYCPECQVLIFGKGHTNRTTKINNNSNQNC